jgi:hypothetical protein
VRLLEPRHPERLNAQHSRIIEDLLEIASAGQQDALNSIITMLEDLTVHGLKCRYAKTLQGTPIWELKTRSRGGQKGGARVYWFPLQLMQDDQPEIFAVIVNAEVKAADTANRAKLAEALELYLAFKHDPAQMLRSCA